MRVSQERRRFRRAKRVLSFQHRLFKRNGKKMTGNWHVSTTQNMSFGGVLFASSVEYKLQDILEMKIVMSGVLDLFNGLGQVVRINRKPSGVFYLVAVSFSSDRATAARRLNSKKNIKQTKKRAVKVKNKKLNRGKLNKK